jgi:nucleoside-diphosphate-sugar epimerase
MHNENTNDDTGASQSASPSTTRSTATRLVVGCGYLGKRVARLWLAAGDRVFGITRSPARAAELAAIGITPVVYDVTSDPNSPPWETLQELPPFDTVFWAVGFDRTSGTTHRDVHVAGLTRLAAGDPVEFHGRVGR